MRTFIISLIAASLWAAECEQEKPRMAVETFNSSDTWTAPAGVTSVFVECYGAGGGGSQGDDFFPLGAGGGGAYAAGTVSVTPSNNYTVTVGAGGANGSDSGDDGGDSWFSSEATLKAGGGGGGGGNGGGGGTASGSALTTGNDGGDGGSSSGSPDDGGGGGGGAAGASGNGGNGSANSGGTGGAGGTGTGDGGDGGAGGNTDEEGNPGTAPGGGGGGGAAGQLGASGAAGRVVLTYTAANPVEIITTSLPAGQLTVAYVESITAQDGTTPYSWDVVSGSLPNGLSLSSTGTPSATLSGTPTGIATTYNFTVEVTDDASETDTQAFSLVIGANVEIVTTSMAGGQVGVAYSENITAQDGTTPYGWSLFSGSLPPGLSLGPTGTPSTTISGTPTTAGEYVFTVIVTDDVGGADSRELTITIGVSHNLRRIHGGLTRNPLLGSNLVRV